jgi:flagellar hook-length control protein FliK
VPVSHPASSSSISPTHSGTAAIARGAAEPAPLGAFAALFEAAGGDPAATHDSAQQPPLPKPPTQVQTSQPPQVASRRQSPAPIAGDGAASPDAAPAPDAPGQPASTAPASLDLAWGARAAAVDTRGQPQKHAAPAGDVTEAAEPQPPLAHRSPAADSGTMGEGVGSAPAGSFPAQPDDLQAHESASAPAAPLPGEREVFPATLTQRHPAIAAEPAAERKTASMPSQSLAALPLAPSGLGGEDRTFAVDTSPETQLPEDAAPAAAFAAMPTPASAFPASVAGGAQAFLQGPASSVGGMLNRAERGLPSPAAAAGEAGVPPATAAASTGTLSAGPPHSGGAPGGGASEGAHGPRPDMPAAQASGGDALPELRPVRSEAPLGPAGASTSPPVAVSAAAVPSAAQVATMQSAQPRSPAHAQNSVAIEGLPVAIAARAAEGRQRFEIRLDPPELGRIDVRLDFARDGQLMARLVVDRAETLDLLRRDSASLEKALESAGLRADDGGLQFSLRDHSHGQEHARGDALRPDVLIVPDEDLAVREAVQRAYNVLRGLGRGIDIRI